MIGVVFYFASVLSATPLARPLHKTQLPQHLLVSRQFSSAEQLHLAAQLPTRPPARTHIDIHRPVEDVIVFCGGDRAAACAGRCSAVKCEHDIALLIPLGWSVKNNSCGCIWRARLRTASHVHVMHHPPPQAPRCLIKSRATPYARVATGGKCSTPDRDTSITSCASSFERLGLVMGGTSGQAPSDCGPAPPQCAPSALNRSKPSSKVALTGSRQVRLADSVAPCDVDYGVTRTTDSRDVYA
eukprot:CAMPEP_0177631808 /NCGR_PEP_ID=MMETSP0447-20121125/1943_1 /TAXON_ID=0 /ORGANISM="Stygamoeba regulata, Strain BSH-02190019" /LENGTH=241 /DNA_ID=CAMNT_0019133309 /DNA_START=281 /DNA_END=1005 /DNA_ORIENTATION=+